MITAGIDIGSLTTKAVIIEDSKVMAHKLVPTGDSGYQAAASAVEGALALAAVDIKDIAKFVFTGAGRSETPYDGEQATEMLCDVKGALFYYPSAKTVMLQENLLGGP